MPAELLFLGAPATRSIASKYAGIAEKSQGEPHRRKAAFRAIATFTAHYLGERF